MRFLTRSLRRIGARLYLVLGFAVFLTLFSSGVGVYYFERSGDLNFQFRSESVPVLDSAWEATRGVNSLRLIGHEMLYEPDSSQVDVSSTKAQVVFEDMEGELRVVGGAPALEQSAAQVQAQAHELLTVLDNIALNRLSQIEASAARSEIRLQAGLGVIPGGGRDGMGRYAGLGADDLRVLQGFVRQGLSAAGEDELEVLWNEAALLSGSSTGELGPAVSSLVLDEGGVFDLRVTELAFSERAGVLENALRDVGLLSESEASGLLALAQGESVSALDASGEAFDRGRLLLAIISVASVVVATLASWLWVGNGLVRRLSRLSERMRQMAHGDLEMPVPEVGNDEIGELAEALEVFRQQALEVQRLNLVEQLYAELREANAELTRMQDRLVAKEKLAALGELVSGVAHEISNPLNFVKNFSEGSVELYSELSEMLDGYRAVMSEDDVALLDELGVELTTSLDRVCSNGGRVLSIVERMRGLGVVGGEAVPAELNGVLRLSSQAACSAFEVEWGDFSVEPEFNLEDAVGMVPIVANDFGEAVKNLVSNACFSMRLRQTSGEDGYLPGLRIYSRLEGDNVVVGFRDNGTGISEDVLEKMFNPFFSTREGILGAGLGLSVAADVLRRVGGNVSADTVLGEYAEFVIELPARG